MGNGRLVIDYCVMMNDVRFAVLALRRQSLVGVNV
jgi:hypothetical protein